MGQGCRPPPREVPPSFLLPPFPPSPSSPPRPCALHSLIYVTALTDGHNENVTLRSRGRLVPSFPIPQWAPPGAPMETEPKLLHEGMQVDAREAPPPAAGPMETEGSSSGGQARVPSQPSTPRSRRRTTAPTHPSGMWFCPMPRCARREGASLTGWGCLQSLVSHLRSVHLSTGAAPQDAWLDTHGLRVCLACWEITAQGAGCPRPRCSTAVVAALAQRNSAPPAQARSPLAVPLPAGRDLVHLLGTQIPTLRRVSIAASSTCARALTCLL